MGKTSTAEPLQDSPAEGTAPPAAAPQDQQPRTGGTYTRQADGSLVRDEPPAEVKE